MKYFKCKKQKTNKNNKNNTKRKKNTKKKKQTQIPSAVVVVAAVEFPNGNGNSNSNANKNKHIKFICLFMYIQLATKLFTLLNNDYKFYFMPHMILVSFLGENNHNNRGFYWMSLCNLDIYWKFISKTKIIGWKLLENVVQNLVAGKAKVRGIVHTCSYITEDKNVEAVTKSVRENPLLNSSPTSLHQILQKGLGKTPSFSLTTIDLLCQTFNGRLISSYITEHENYEAVTKSVRKNLLLNSW